MRILSQTGMIDLPYESIGISINHNDNTKIVAYPAENYNKEFGSWKMAEYSTTEKAQKAMEMLRNFNEVRKVRNIPIRRDIIDTMFEPLRKLFQIYTKWDDEILKMDLVKVVNYFKFPADDEIEV